MTALSAVKAALSKLPMLDFDEDRPRPTIVPLGGLVDDADLTRMAAAAFRAAAAPVLALHQPCSEPDHGDADHDYPDYGLGGQHCAACVRPWPCPTAQALGVTP